MNIMTQAKHTATPWKTLTAKLAGDGLSTIYSDDARYPLALGLREANAELIVRAVNSHEALVEACKEALILFDHLGKSAGDFLAVELCEKALKKCQD